MRIIAFFTLCLLLAFPVSAAAGVTLPSLEARTFFFEPGAEYEWTWRVFGSENLQVSLTGGLLEYAELADPAPGTGPREVTFRLKLPEELPPGRHILYLAAQEDAAEGMIGGRAVAAGGIVIISLYPGPYLDMSFSVENTAVGQPTQASVELESWSEETIESTAVQVEVFGQNGSSLLKALSEPVSIPSTEKRTLEIPLATQGFQPGSYRAVATVFKAQPGLNAEAGFKVGTLDLELNDYSRALTAGRINRFAFALSSIWNRPLEGVYGELELGDEKGKSASESIAAFSDKEFEAFIDASRFDPNSTLEGNLTIYFRDAESEETRKLFPISVAIVAEQIPETQVPEKPPLIPLNAMTLLYFALAILVVINLLLLFRRKEKKSGEEEQH